MMFSGRSPRMWVSLLVSMLLELTMECFIKLINKEHGKGIFKDNKELDILRREI